MNISNVIEGALEERGNAGMVIAWSLIRAGGITGAGRRSVANASDQGVDTHLGDRGDVAEGHAAVPAIAA